MLKKKHVEKYRIHQGVSLIFCNDESTNLFLRKIKAFIFAQIIHKFVATKLAKLSEEFVK